MMDENDDLIETDAVLLRVAKVRTEIRLASSQQTSCSCITSSGYDSREPS